MGLFQELPNREAIDVQPVHNENGAQALQQLPWSEPPSETLSHKNKTAIPSKITKENLQSSLMMSQTL